MSAATILTLANGKGVDLLDPKSDDIDFAVIAEHLAKEKRYNGATREVEYSVAEHCVRGAYAIHKFTNDAQLAAYFLLHDAHEAFIKDDTTPKKRALAEIAAERFGVLSEQIMMAFQLLEYRIDVAVHDAAGLAWPPHNPETVKQIKAWDLTMFVTEWRDLMPGIEHPNWKPYADVVPLPEPVVPWHWQIARKAYVARCMKLLPSLQRKLAIVGGAQ